MIWICDFQLRSSGNARSSDVENASYIWSISILIGQRHGIKQPSELYNRQIDLFWCERWH